MTILVFDDPPAVFIRIRKTGSTSVTKALFGSRNKAAKISEGKFLPEWREQLVFTFVRNPFDRLVSCYEMFRTYPVRNAEEEAQRRALDLSKVLDIVEDDAVPIGGKSYLGKLRQHAIPMTHPTYFLEEAKFVGRFENFNEDGRKLRGMLGARIKRKKKEFEPALEPRLEEPMPHLRKSAPRDYRSYFDDHMRARTERIFGEDLARFEYHF